MVQGVRSRCTKCKQLHRDCVGYPCSVCIKRGCGESCDPADLEARLSKLERNVRTPAMDPLATPPIDNKMIDNVAENSSSITTSENLNPPSQNFNPPSQENIENNTHFDQEIDMAGMLPLAPDIPGTPYDFAGSSKSRCMELTAGGHPCGMTNTYICEAEGPPFHVVVNICHACRHYPNNYNLINEAMKLEKNRLYLCHDCTEQRSKGPKFQLWEHPRRDRGETKERKDIFCNCDDRLKNGWICKQHRQVTMIEIEKRGQEKVKSFRGFVGDVCAACRTGKPKTQGYQGVLMWECAACDDLVIDRTFEIPSEPNLRPVW